MSNENLRLPEGIVTAPMVRHPKQFLSEAWLRSLTYFRSSSRKVVQTPPKQQEQQVIPVPVMLASCELPQRPPPMSPQSSSFVHPQPEVPSLPVPSIRLDCPVVMGYLLKYSELEHNCEVECLYTCC